MNSAFRRLTRSISAPALLSYSSARRNAFWKVCWRRCVWLAYKICVRVCVCVCLIGRGERERERERERDEHVVAVACVWLCSGSGGGAYLAVAVDFGRQLAGSNDGGDLLLDRGHVGVAGARHVTERHRGEWAKVLQDGLVADGGQQAHRVRVDVEVELELGREALEVAEARRVLALVKVRDDGLHDGRHLEELLELRIVDHVELEVGTRKGRERTEAAVDCNVLERHELVPNQ